MFRKKQNTVWSPHPGSQDRFMRCTVWECLLQGSRGGGKTDALLMDYARGVGKGYGPDYSGLILREATTELGDIIKKSKKYFPRMFPGCKFNEQRKIWTFAGGESLWFNYARVIEDYDQYHGQEFSIKSSTYIKTKEGDIRADNINIGDYLKTLQGYKKVTNVIKSKKVGVKLSVFDSNYCLVGEQYQGVLHPVLTNAGWQRLGLSVLSSTSLQSQFVELVTEEVQKFLLGVHQEILGSLSHFSQSNQLGSPISSVNRQLFSFVHQIYYQLISVIVHLSSSVGFDLCIDLSNLSAFLVLLNSGIFFESCEYELRNILQLLLYCEFLTSLSLQIHQFHIHQIHSILFHSLGKSILLKLLKYPLSLKYQEVKHYNHLQHSLLSVLMQDQISWNDTFAYVQTLKKVIQGYRGDCHHVYDLDDELPLQVLGTFQPYSPLQNDVQKQIPVYPQKDDHYILSERNHSQNNFYYNHPYLHGLCQTNFELNTFSVSVSACDHLLDFVDFEVEDDNHYLSSISPITNDITNNQNNQQLFLINQNCFIGWEELTNQAVPDIYLKLMSCNRSSNPKIPKKYRATCNPSGAGHAWVKQRFIDAVQEGRVLREPVTLELPNASGELVPTVVEVTRTHIFSDLRENITLLRADPLYKAKIIQMTQDNEMLKKAWVHGSWDIIAGGFFVDVWNPKVHIIRFPIAIPTSWKCIRSFDWGSSKPWSVTYFVEANGEQPFLCPFYIPKGSVIVINEIYGWTGEPNKGDMATSQTIAKRTLAMDNAIRTEYGITVQPGPADSSIYDVRDGKSIGVTMASFGLHWTRAYKGQGSRVTGWALIRQMLGAALRGELEAPHLYFLQQASHHIRTLPQMQRDPKKPEDIDSSLEDHALDGLRYGLARKYMEISRRGIGI